MALDISHDAAAGRFEVVVDGVRCELEYDRRGDVMRITHTGVPAQVGGRGIAGELVRAAFETARAQGWRVEPVCSYAAAWIERHPQYADLVSRA